MSLIFWIVLKSTLILVAGLAAASSAGKARASVRHLILACTFAALLILPAVSFVASPTVFEWAILEPVNRARTEATGLPNRRSGAGSRSGIDDAAALDEPDTTAFAAPPSPRWSAVAFSGLVWSAGVGLLAMALAMALLRLRTIRRRGLPWIPGENLANQLARAREVSREVGLALHEGIATPMTYGVLRPLIVLPNDAISWSEGDLQRALVHEIEHVRRRDWVVQMMARGVCALYWFHPLVWVAWRRLRLEGERACDDAVLLGSQGTDYAQQLVALAQRLSTGEGGLVLSMANRSDLSVRVRAVLDGSQPRGRAGRSAVAAIAGLAGLLAVGVAPVSVVAVERASAFQTPTAADRAAAEKALVEKVQIQRARRLELERAEKLKRDRAEIVAKMTRADAELAVRSEAERRAMIEKLREELALSSGVAGGIKGGVEGGVAGGVSGGVEGVLREKEVRAQMAIIEKLSRRDRELREKKTREALLIQQKLEGEYRKEMNALIEAEYEKAVSAQQREYLAQGRKVERGERRVSRRARGEALVEAAEAGDIAFVTQILDGGLDVNTVVLGDGTALIGAARGSQLEMTEFLLGRGADPNLVARGDGSPLILAAREGSLEVVKLLLDRGADINLGVPGDGNPLIMAAGAGRLHVVELLLDRGADIEKVVPGDENALIHACEGGSLPVVKLLVERGANINARVRAEHWYDDERGEEWRTPLSMARRNGHRAVIEFLVSRGAKDS